ncbi:MAG TPA: class I SAM-dependent methyltransferase [Lentimicrobium sp.]|nr:class I SAM-dependent methyltransferase [Lentimicrobium sp.]
MIHTITPILWKDYELIDSGNFSKLERFGNQVLDRPEPQAVWDRSLTNAEWDKRSSAIFRKEKNDPDKGRWILNKGCKEQWLINYVYKELSLNMRLGLTGFKHIGVFPEQADNWNFIFDRLNNYKIQNRNGAKPKVLNLFAYTGGASLAAAAAGAEVYHVDSVKPVITWARENAEASELNGIRWIVEDALKFVKREVRRGSRYQGIMLDPPAYGRGADGEKWVLEENINEMIKLCAELLDKNHAFFILSLYSMGLSALIGENLINNAFGKRDDLTSGELYIEDSFNKKLPLGTIVRF